MSRIPVPSCPGVDVEAEPQGREGLRVSYAALPDDLIAAGIAMPDTLAHIGKSAKKALRVDARDNRVYVKRWLVKRDGRPVEKVGLLYLNLPRVRALALPGVVEALEAHEREQEEERAHWARLEIIGQRNVASSFAGTVCPSTEQVRPRARPQYLRLVVDNTRRTAS